MKSLIQPLLARLRATAVPAGRPKLIDTKAVIERSLRQAGLMPPAADAPAAANDASDRRRISRRRRRASGHCADRQQAQERTSPTWQEHEFGRVQRKRRFASLQVVRADGL